MKTSSLSDAELTAYSGEHILYELKLLQWTAAELGAPKSDVMRSVLIESFAIHLRNLIDFFFTLPTHDDDVTASVFCAGWSETLTVSLDAAKTRANKEVSHLTLGRKDGVNPGKVWNVSGLFQEVREVARRFAANASPAKLHADVRQFLSLPDAGAVAAVGTMSTSNTTSATLVSVSSNR